MVAEASSAGPVAGFLEVLEQFGCRRLDGRVIPSINAEVDHVLVAPPGVFVIGVKDWEGHLTVADGVLHRDGVPRPDDLAALSARA